MALWDVRETLQREAERFEFILADGWVVWDHAGVVARHPVLLQRVQLEYDPELPRFRVVESLHPTELYAALFRRLGEDSPVADLLRAIGEGRVHPLGGQETDAFLTRMATLVDPRGEFLGRQDTEPAQRPTLQVYRGPVLFLRNRSLGFEAILEGIQQSVATTDHVPEALAALVGLHPPMGSQVPVSDPFVQGDPADRILLSKEANEEQFEIALRLERYGAVLVKGPPGTGKTHTIANLIGHVLAEGKTVLVTSHTAKALRVLREKVVEPLQSLCVSVLEGDSTANSELRQSVTEIGHRLSSTSADEMRRKAASLAQERAAILAELRKARAQLMRAVTAEYSEVVVSGETLAPARAAQHVAAGIGHDDWIPGEVQKVAFPLTEVEVRALYQSNSDLPPSVLRDIDFGLPDPEALVSPHDFAQMVEREALYGADAVHGQEFWEELRTDEPPDEPDRFLEAVEGTLSRIADAEPWEAEAVAAGATPDEARPWRRLLAVMESYAQAAAEARLSFQEWGQVLASGMPEGLAIALLDQMLPVARAQGEASVGMFTHRNWRPLLEGSSARSAPPWREPQLLALRRTAVESQLAKELIDRWDLLVRPLGGQPLGRNGKPDERACADLAERLGSALEMAAAGLEFLTSRAEAAGFRWRAFFPELTPRCGSGAWRSAADRAAGELAAVVAARRARIARRNVDISMDQLTHELLAYRGADDPSLAVGALLSAVRNRTPESYEEAYERLTAAYAQKGLAENRELLLKRLSACAPSWAESIRRRVAEHSAPEPPGSAERAWLWRQLADEVESRASISVTDTLEAINHLRERLRSVTASLIEHRAWAAQIERTQPAERQALAGYVETIRRMGRGTGKRVPALRKAAREQMALAREAVPVWIAPLSRVAEAFGSARRFDVVIIDEASQSDVMGLIAWYLGNQVMVVGDDQQVTPDAVALPVATVQSLISSYLDGIPNAHLYDGQASVYQLASTAFSGVVSLVEHFRCVPEIISFSNKLSYNLTIQPLRDPGDAQVFPPVISERIETTDTIGDVRNVNPDEAIHVASLVAAAIEQPEYEHSTFGIISLLGNEHDRVIEQHLRNFVTLDKLYHHRVLCGAPPQFQGDERDVIFLSMVDGPPANPPHNRRGDPGERFQKRYNVAASRACDQLWVVHSLDPARDLKPDDLRKTLLDFARNPRAWADASLATSAAESPFEAEVARRLVAAGYQVSPQHPVGGYRIDIVVGKADRRLAVECDGAAFHWTDEQIRSDLSRQAQLERMGWTFYRLRGTEFYRDPDKALGRLVRRLEELGIPRGLVPDSAAEPSGGDELITRVRARAAQIRREFGSRAGHRPRNEPMSETRGWQQAQPVIEARASVEPEPRSDAGQAQQRGEPDRSRAHLRLHTTDGSSALRPRAQVEHGPSADLVQRLRVRGLKVEDNRAKGGALWIVGPAAAAQRAVDELRLEGIRFSWAKRRGQWFLP